MLNNRSSFIDVDIKDHVEISPFLGLFEGKNKKTSTETSSNSSSDNSSSSAPGSNGIVKGILGIFSSGLSAAGQIAPVLPSLGIGSKSRLAEIEANKEANKELIEAQTAANKTNAKEEDKKIQMYIFGGFGLLVLILVIVVASKSL